MTRNVSELAPEEGASRASVEEASPWLVPDLLEFEPSMERLPVVEEIAGGGVSDAASQAAPSDNYTGFIRWLVLEVAMVGPSDSAVLDVLCQAADRQAHHLRSWLAHWGVFDGMSCSDELPDECRISIGRRLGHALLEMEPEKFQVQLPYLDLARCCATALLADGDVMGASLHLSAILAGYAVQPFHPWTSLPEGLRALVKNPSSRDGSRLFVRADALVRLCRLEMASPAPFQDRAAWTEKVLRVASIAFCVRAGSPRTIKPMSSVYAAPDVARDWRDVDRHVMRAISREFGARQDLEGQAHCVEALIWLDALHGAQSREVEMLQPVGGPALVVCKDGFAPASDRSDGGDEDMLSVCAPLCSPLPLPAAPSASALEAASRELMSEFPWAKPVLEEIFGQLSATTALGASTLYLEPTLIVGQPGAGKSRLVRRLAEVLHLERVDIPLGGTDDTKVLSGTSRGWATGRPGDILMAMAERRTASVAVILDELDKASEGRNSQGSVYSYLLALMEPETACAYRDSFLKTPCDLSAVIWLATANALSTIPTALRSRLRILHLEQPQQQHYRAIAAGALDDLAKRWRIDQRAMPTVAELELPWDGLSSARDVRRAVEAGVTKYALRSGRAPSH